jgi:hypothetical protein
MGVDEHRIDAAGFSSSNFHLPSPISQFDFDAASFPAHTRRMANFVSCNRD